MNGSTQLAEVPAWHRWLVLMALAAVGIVFARGSLDLARFSLAWFSSLLFLPILMFFVWSLGLVSANLRIGFGNPEVVVPPAAWTRGALVLAIPVGFLASGLDCMGISLSGCTPVCAFLIRIWTPAVAVAAVVYVRTGRRWLLPVMTVMCMVYLLPNCQCNNPLNSWWLHHLPRSPACFAANSWVSVIAIAALSWGKWMRTAVLACWLINVVLLGFFVGHHYYQIPW